MKPLQVKSTCQDKQQMLHNFSNHYVQLDMLRLWETPNKRANAPANTVLRSEIWELGRHWRREKWKEIGDYFDEPP